MLELELLLQIDYKVRGFSSLLSEAMGTDESFVSVRFDHNHLAVLSTVHKYSRRWTIA